MRKLAYNAPMSMIGNLRRTTEARVRALLADPSTISAYLNPGIPADPQQAEAFMREMFANPARALEAVNVKPDDAEDLCLDKDWYGLHYLFTGTNGPGSPPLDFLAAGGAEVGDIDVGYGPARVLAASQVAELHRALAGLSHQELLRRYNPDEMEALQVYPGGWQVHGELALNSLLAAFDELRPFIAAAAAAGEALLVWID